MMVFGNNEHAITCKELKVSLNEMLKAMDGMNKNTWIYAYHLNRIIENESFKDDFHDKGNFAKFVGLSIASISQYTGAIRFAKSSGYIDCIVDGKIVANKFGIIPFNVGIAYLLSTLDNYNDFIAWVENNKGITEVDIFRTSQKALRDIIKAYNDSLKPCDSKVSDSDSDTEQASDSDTEQASDSDSDSDSDSVKFKIACKADAIAVIANLMRQYDISINDIGSELAKRNK